MTKILVIDDAKFSRKRVTSPLEEAGYEVVQAGNGQEGLNAVENQQFDGIVTDLLMPVMDGIDFITEVRKQGIETPVIVVTADIQKTTRKKCEDLGVNGFINKPFLPEDLLKEVNQIFPTTSGVLS